jgi:uncharacterized protein
MTFRRRTRLDPTQVRDARGQSGLGRGLPGGRVALAGGGGITGIIVLVIFVLLGGDPGGSPLSPGGFEYAGGADNGNLGTDCRTGADANERQDCRIVGIVNSVQAYWGDTFEASQIAYVPATTTLFTGGIATDCGYATSAVGPFYCPNGGAVYLDLGFFDDLRFRLGARGGPFAEAYVVAHEYGHHVQDLLGILDAGSGGRGSDSGSVRVELQADCFAGVWAGHAAETGYLEPPTTAEIDAAMDAAGAVGDDRIQRRTQGEVDPETWTHGSSDQRRSSFATGYETGDAARCDAG